MRNGILKKVRTHSSEAKRYLKRGADPWFRYPVASPTRVFTLFLIPKNLQKQECTLIRDTQESLNYGFDPYFNGPIVYAKS